MTQRIIVYPSAETAWHSVVKDAQNLYGKNLDEDIEHYTVITLERLMTFTGLDNNIHCIQLLRHVSDNSQFNRQALRNTGDECLVLLSLFKERIVNGLTSTTYIRSMGEHCYSVLSLQPPHSSFSPRFFTALRDNFSDITKMLNQVKITTK